MNRPQPLDSMSPAKRMLYLSSRRTGKVAAAFSLLVCTLMLANYLQLRTTDPLNTKALVELRERFEQDSANEKLQGQIRAVDMLARKAYFSSMDHLRIGGYLLLGGVALLLVCLQIMGEVRKSVPYPEGCVQENSDWMDSVRGRRLITFSGVGLLCLALLMAILNRTQLSRHSVARIDKPAVEEISEEVAAPVAPPPAREVVLQNWPGFRGPDGNGIAYAEDVPVEWDGETGENILWKSEVPKAGFSSPVAWERKIFLTGGDEQGCELYCFNANDGALLWKVETAGVNGLLKELPEVDSNTGYAAPSAATDGRAVCAMFASGDLLACDLDGNVLWARNMGVPDNHYAHSSSLLIYQNILVVQIDDNSDPRLLGLDVMTGKEVWKVKRSVISWASPICVNTGSRWELIVADSDSVASYNPLSGELYWQNNCLGGELGPSAAYAAGRVFVANDAAQAVGLVLTAAGGVSNAWEWSENLPDTASPVATEDLLFIATSYGPFICLDAASGETLWEYEFDAGFYASPIKCGGLIYAMDEEGVMHIFDAADEYYEVTNPPLGEKSVCTPALQNGRIYIRGAKHLFAVGE